MPLDKTVAYFMTLIANINKKISAIPCETSLILNLNLDILVFKFQHTQCGMFMHSLVLDTSWHWTVSNWATPELVKKK